MHAICWTGEAAYPSCDSPTARGTFPLTPPRAHPKGRRSPSRRPFPFAVALRCLRRAGRLRPELRPSRRRSLLESRRGCRRRWRFGSFLMAVGDVKRVARHAAAAGTTEALCAGVEEACPRRRTEIDAVDLPACMRAPARCTNALHTNECPVVITPAMGSNTSSPGPPQTSRPSP